MQADFKALADFKVFVDFKVWVDFMALADFKAHCHLNLKFMTSVTVHDTLDGNTSDGLICCCSPTLQQSVTATDLIVITRSVQMSS